MLVLGIETSCDETAVALYDRDRGLLAHTLYSQVSHAQYGGVVPELASRDHIQKLLPLVQQVLAQSQCELRAISGVAYTAGPGLMGALLVGAAFAQSFALARQIPCLGVHHLEGHLLSPLLDVEHLALPFLALLVSGGHTMLVKVDALGQYTVLGESLDDAAGEAFDKTAKLMGLPYPGGPRLAQLATQGDAKRYALPRPLWQRKDFMFSFSGLKTAVAQLLTQVDIQQAAVQADVAASFQAAVVDILVHKTLQAAEYYGLKRVVVSGGVSANQQLRQQLQQGLHRLGGQVFYPRLEFCTDNGAMIAFAGCLRLAAGQRNLADFSVRAKWPLTELEKI